MSINVCFANETNTNPNERQCLLIGKLEHVQAIPAENIAKRYNNVVSKETVAQGVNSLSANDKVHLHLKNLCLATLPEKVSRHNAPMLPHALTAFIQSNASTTPQQSISIICERDAAFALGLAAARAFPLYNQKTSLPKNDINVTVDFSFLDKPLTEKELHLLMVGAQSVRLAAKIVDMPCNVMNTDDFLKEIKTVGEDLDIEPVIIRGDDLDKKGFGGIFGVGKAACHPPALAVLSHRPEGATKNIAWCGKGIVYDTGGLSIKGKTFMPGMKRDCGGAAGVLGAFRAAVKMGFTENLHAVFCLAENAVGPVATRPDDVHTLYSGLTVEINNTDAEGRLVLGDGVAYAKKDLKCDVIVDMATLTGAQGIATGKYHASIVTNREDWEVDCVKAGKMSGDLVHPMPYAPELHFDEFSSTVADMKNSVKDRSNAQVSCAGLFIGSHIGFDYPGVWLHIDMAAPAEIGNERASGYGVALLLALFGKTTKSEFLNEIAPN